MKHLNVSLCVILALSAMAVVKAQVFTGSIEMTADTKILAEKCSKEIEGLKLCVNSSELVIDSGEPVSLKLFWVNSSNSERNIVRRSTGYSVTVNDEYGGKLVPRIQKKIQENTMSSEDLTKWLKLNGGSNRGIQIGANQTETDEIRLNKYYDYDLSAKGTYYVSIKKSVSSIDGDKNIEFILDNIEIQVK